MFVAWTSTRESASVAILVDFENIRIAVEKHCGRTSARDIFRAIHTDSATFGRVLIANAYLRTDLAAFAGTSTEVGGDALAEGFDPIFVVPKLSGGENRDRTDIRLSLDGLRIVLTRPDVSVLVLASGDGDFGELGRIVVQSGRRFVVASVEGAVNRELKALAEPFVEIRSALGRKGTSSQVGHRSGQVGSRSDVRTLEPINAACVSEAAEASASRVPEAATRQAHPDGKEWERLILVLASTEERFVTSGGYVGEVMFARDLAVGGMVASRDAGLDLLARGASANVAIILRYHHEDNGKRSAAIALNRRHASVVAQLGAPPDWWLGRFSTT